MLGTVSGPVDLLTSGVTHPGEKGSDLGIC